MRKIYKMYISIFVILVTIILVYITWIFLKAPEVKVNIRLQPITQYELEKMNPAIYQSQLKSIPLMNLKKLEINVNILDSIGMKIRKVEIPDIIYLIDNYDYIRSIEGGSQEKNNKSELGAEYERYVYFNSHDLDINKIRNIFQQAYINIYLENLYGKHCQYLYLIADYIVKEDIIQ